MKNYAFKIQVEGADAPMFSYNREQAFRIVKNLMSEGKCFTLTAMKQHYIRQYPKFQREQ